MSDLFDDLFRAMAEEDASSLASEEEGSTRWEIQLGDCLDVMRTMDDASVDSIVTDPPYGLSFMSANWDHGVPGIEFWKEALRVSKPGTHLVAFGGPRTHHRLMVAIEDAGWEIRDCSHWMYGCLSDDTEVLTPYGWERYNKATTSEVLIYDPDTDVYQWEKPSRWSVYRIQQDTAYRVESDSTDQIVSRNHRCLVERDGKLIFMSAEELADMERMPYLRGGFSSLPQKHRALLFPDVLWKGEDLDQGTCSQRKESEVPWEGSCRFNEPSMEGGTDLLQAEGEVREPEDQVCAVSSIIQGNGQERRLRHGTSLARGDGIGETIDTSGMCTSRQPRCDGQQAPKPDALCIERRPQEVRARPSYRTTLATITPFKYTGVIFCPTVSTGAFIARRNSKVFITGNSGFPKSLSVSKMLDKMAGAEREVVGVRKRNGGPSGMTSASGWNAGPMAQDDGTVVESLPATEAAKKWSGWGTAQKPAIEPIVLARKPLEGTVARNVMKYGTGALNIDGCRVDIDNSRRMCGVTNTDSGVTSFKTGARVETHVDVGRWPANLIWDGSEEVKALFPHTGPGDSDSASRYFKVTPYGEDDFDILPYYCAKANKRDRDEGCEGMEERSKGVADGTKTDNTLKGPGNSLHPDKNSKSRNFHPTVKPVNLMRYLCRLVTPPGGLVLDPFCGSGSTGKGALLEGFKFVGIEREAEYAEIARARCAHAAKTPTTTRKRGS